MRHGVNDKVNRMIDATESFVVEIFRMFCFMLSAISMFAGVITIFGMIIGIGFILYGLVTGDNSILQIGDAFKLVVHSCIGFLISAIVGIPATKVAKLD